MSLDTTRQRIQTLKDKEIRDNMINVVDVFGSIPFNNFVGKYMELNITSAVDNQDFYHGLKFTPEILLPLWISTDGSVIYNYDAFDKDYINLTTTSAMTIRFLIGKFRISK